MTTIWVPPSTISIDTVLSPDIFQFRNRQVAWEWMNRFSGETPYVRVDGSVESGWLHVWYAMLLGYDSIKVFLINE